MMGGTNCLQKLTLKNIPSLISFPAGGLPMSLQTLEIIECGNLVFESFEKWNAYTSLKVLRIRDSYFSPASLPLDCFPGLQYLKLEKCPSLEAITFQGGGAAPKLERFEVSYCKNLMSVAEQIDLPSLTSWYLEGVPKLASFSPSFLPCSVSTLNIGVAILSFMPKRELRLLFQRLTNLSVLCITGNGRKEDCINSLLKEPLLPTSLSSSTRLIRHGCSDNQKENHMTVAPSTSLWLKHHDYS
ncbi:hypothetical protein VNO78_21254 [Psophocarpus tetragonolobus]|uniref:Uncharacterized protein n=1 Tax=Psophocarpus tetragonolobus TaxID=3891 RepID=A0AAN9SBX7_PSOTE